MNTLVIDDTHERVKVENNKYVWLGDLVYAGDVKIKISLDVEDSLYVEDSLDVGGRLYVKGSLDVEDSLYVGGRLDVGDRLYVKGSLDVGDSLYVGGRLKCKYLYYTHYLPPRVGSLDIRHVCMPERERSFWEKLLGIDTQDMCWDNPSLAEMFRAKARELKIDPRIKAVEWIMQSFLPPEERTLHIYKKEQ